ncbi:MAG: hypothetical protein PUK70_03230 [Bacteroidales bacterium]|nr:hypothetical protein [Bacteroidales bacterium]MDY6001464.1 hypothetical protein [Candidatus Cryptobacteroides sp.]
MLIDKSVGSVRIGIELQAISISGIVIESSEMFVVSNDAPIAKRATKIRFFNRFDFYCEHTEYKDKVLWADYNIIESTYRLNNAIDWPMKKNAKQD